jgi:hypothetical protein
MVDRPSLIGVHAPIVSRNALLVTPIAPFPQRDVEDGCRHDRPA